MSGGRRNCSYQVHLKLTAFQIHRAGLIVEWKLLEIHPAVKNSLHSSTEKHFSVRSYRNEHILAIRPHETRRLLVGHVQMWDPDARP